MKLLKNSLIKELKERDCLFLIGIDPGVLTGITVWSRKFHKIEFIATVFIHEAMDKIRDYNRAFPGQVIVRVEDARLRKKFGKTSKEVWQGAGSIKRDSKIWDDFLRDVGIAYEMIAPVASKNKLEPEVFKKITGYLGLTSHHARDSCMLVYNL